VAADVELVECFYRRFRAGDLTCFDLLDPDVEHRTFFGDTRGVDALIAYLESVNELFDEPAPDPEEFFHAGDRVVVLGTWRGRVKANGAEVEARFAHIWRCRAGRLVDCGNYVDSARLLQALDPR
jgi:uncharacterized protein